MGVTAGVAGLAVIGLGLAAWGRTPGASHQPGDRRPDAARRVVAYFDFEERLTNPEPIPMGWRVDQDRRGRERPGFPIYNQPALDYGVAHAGEASVRLPTRGGSTSLVVDTGVIPVFPEADYRVTAMVRTEGLTHARAFVEACMLDAQGNVIEGSRRRSRAVRGGEWTEVEVSLRGDWAEAVFIRIELLVLQAGEFQGQSAGYGRVWPTDVSGSAWFDSVGVVQQPRVTITTGQAGNVVTQPGRPTLDVLTRDTAGERLEARCTVYDVSGAVVARLDRRIVGGRWQEVWDPGLERLGWYRCVVEVVAEGQRIGWGALDFAWLPESRGPGVGQGGLGMIVTECSVREMPGLILASSAAGAEHLTLPAWSGSLRASEVEPFRQELNRALGLAAPLRGRVALSLPRVPQELADALGVRPEQVLRALSGDPGLWGPYLDPLLDSFGQSVGSWQLGAVGDESAMGMSGLGEALAGVRGALARLVPGPRVVVPWRGDRQGPEYGGTAPPGSEHLVLVPASFAAEGLTETVRAWGGSGGDSALSVAGGGGASFALQPFDVDQFGARAAVIDTVKRAVFAWRGSAGADPTLALVDPWVGGTDSRDPLMPRPEVAVWRVLRDRLRGREVVGELEIGAGLRCLLLAPRGGGSDQGALVAWNESAPSERAAIDLMLNLGSVRAVDPFGNETRVQAIEQVRGGLVARRHHIPLTDMPVFVEGIDVSLARLQSSFRIEPGVLEARGTPRDLELVLTNPWATTMSGRAFIVEPGGATGEGGRDRSWRIEPRSFDFEAGPGQVARMPLSVLMREFEESGTKTWVIDLRLTGREDLGWITVSAPLTVGLEGVDLRVSSRVTGADVAVEVTIANTRSTPVLLDATVFAPGYPRERRTIGEMLPRTQVTRRFFYEGGAARLTGQTISASVRETETGARLNAGAVVP